MIKVSNEKYEAPEILFNPLLINSEADPIPELVFNCVNVINNKLELSNGY